MGFRPHISQELGRNVAVFPVSKEDVAWGVVATIHDQRPDRMKGFSLERSPNPRYQMINGTINNSGIMLESERSI